MNHHLLNARSCKYYMLGKFRAWANDDDDDESDDEGDLPSHEHEDHPEDHGDDDEIDYNPMDDPDLQFGLSQLNLDRDDSFFIPRYSDRTTSNVTNEGEGGPGPQTAAHRLRQTAASYHVLDDDDDKREINTCEEAGKVRRKVSPPTLQLESKDANGDTIMREPDEQSIPRSPFFPFTSELDWKVAQWAIKEDPGKNALDRLLSVPGVHLTSLHARVAPTANIISSLGRRETWPLVS